MVPLFFLTATVCLVWDGLLTFKEEHDYIWGSPWSGVKILFLFSRVFGLTMQIINCVLVSSPVLAHLHVKPEVCRKWFSFQVVTFLFLLTALEVLLGLRVYALYNQSRKIGFLLAATIATGFITSTTCGILTVLKLQFDGSCRAPKVPNEVAYFSTVVITVHSTMWLLTIHKRNVGAREGLARIPVVHLMMRDGAWVFVAVCSIIVVLTVYAFAENVAAHILFPWPTTLLSIFICRLILNLHRLKTDTLVTDPELTTCIDVTQVMSRSIDAL